MRQGYLLSLRLLTIILEVLASEIRQVKKAIQIGTEEIKVSPFLVT